MIDEQKPEPVVFTNSARCRDCYRCVRVCPVKAISIKDGQASVEENRCINCGTCIRECPQKAKSYRHELAKAIALVENNDFVAISIAPSFAALFDEQERKRLSSALRRIGFSHVAETAVGAYYVAKMTSEYINHDVVNIFTACPAVVSYIERYRPDVIDAFVPLVSPMAAHGRYLRKRFGEDIKIVFAGPCVGKKSEAERKELKGIIDAVITFDELFEWLDQQNICVSNCEESEFDDIPGTNSRYFSLEGGGLKTASMKTDMLAENIISVSGFAELNALLDRLEKIKAGCVIEPLFCEKGCINGPGMPDNGNLFERKSRVLEYAKENFDDTSSMTNNVLDLDLKTDFESDGFVEPQFKEQEIRFVLEKTGKQHEEDQLNCGACGYSSCLDQAKAVLAKMADAEMCIPYMRRMAEQRSDLIMETSPNGIIILDKKLNILNMNPAFAAMFSATCGLIGRNISYLIDPGPFEKLLSGEKNMVDMTAQYRNYNLICRQIIYPLPAEHQFVGIFINLTTTKENEQKLSRLKEDTIKQARDLYEHQIDMAKNFAQFLGEYTAKGESLVSNLIEAAAESIEKSDYNV